MKPLPHTRSCFVCGQDNPKGFHLQSETDGRIVRARVVFSSEHVGFKQTIHGGLTATLLDEVMSWACAVQAGRFAYCAELNVRYLQPVRPGQPVVVTGELVANRRGRLFEAKSTLASETGTLLASGTGKYLPLPESDATVMATDFIGDTAWLFPAKTSPRAGA